MFLDCIILKFTHYCLLQQKFRHFPPLKVSKALPELVLSFFYCKRTCVFQYDKDEILSIRIGCKDDLNYARSGSFSVFTLVSYRICWNFQSLLNRTEGNLRWFNFLNYPLQEFSTMAGQAENWFHNLCLHYFLCVRVFSLGKYELTSIIFHMFERTAETSQLVWNPKLKSWGIFLDQLRNWLL